MTFRVGIPMVAIFSFAFGLRGDQIEMRNGDHYNGKVVSMTADSVVLQSDVLGRITVPRTNVANVNFSAAALASTNAALPASTNVNPRMAAALRNLGANSNVVEMVRQQFLAGAGPEANGKFDELASGLFTGKLDVEKIRKEARAAADQLRELKKSGDMGEPFDSYLAVLDKFLKDSAPPAASSAPASTPSASAPAPGTNGVSAKAVAP